MNKNNVYSDRNDLVFIKYKKQVAFYLKHGVKPIDITLDENETIIFIYTKVDTYELHNKFKAENKAENKDNNINVGSMSIMID